MLKLLRSQVTFRDSSSFFYFTGGGKYSIGITPARDLTQVSTVLESNYKVIGMQVKRSDSIFQSDGTLSTVNEDALKYIKVSLLTIKLFAAAIIQWTKMDFYEI